MCKVYMLVQDLPRLILCIYCRLSVGSAATYLAIRTIQCYVRPAYVSMNHLQTLQQASISVLEDK